jgi:arylsulfatase
MRGYIADHAATIAEVLQDNGYATACIGKWHLAPMAQASAAGPFDHWPLQRGFDRFYGFLQGETDQFHPELTADNHHIDPPAGPEDGYHVSEDLVDKAIGFVNDTKSVRPDRPFFMYLAFGATHAPHQAPDNYREKYRGRFDAGWDVVRQEWFQNQINLGVVPEGTVLAPRNPGVEAWEDLSLNQQRFACRLQEAFAAMLDHTDAQIGRLIGHLERLGLLDDTVIMLLSDNGASQEGGPTGVTDEMKHFQRGPGGRGHRRRATGRDRWTPFTQQLSVGLGTGRQHPHAVVQADDTRRRGPRPIDCPLARRDRWSRGEAEPVPPHHRPDAHPP